MELPISIPHMRRQATDEQRVVEEASWGLSSSMLRELDSSHSYVF